MNNVSSAETKNYSRVLTIQKLIVIAKIFFLNDQSQKVLFKFLGYNFLTAILDQF